MLAILIGALALAFGLLLMLLPLMASQLARPRDGLWAAVVLILGLVLVTGAERLTGGPMLGVLCGGLLIGRLSTEVGQQRWAVLDQSERDQLRQREYWQGQLIQLKDALQKLLTALVGLLGWIKDRLRKPAITKKWVRADAQPSSESTTPEEGASEAANDLITEQPSEDADSKAGAETIELKADLLEPQAEPQQHNNPATSENSSKATSVELAGENIEQPNPSADQAQEPASTSLDDTLPVVEADILDPEPLPSPIDSSSAVSVIESLDEVDALIADGRN